jgi:hypothetical protein
LAEKLQCEFSLIRYVPDPVKDEFVNIGVLLRQPSAPERMELRFTRDWTRVRCIHPEADIAMLEALEIEVRQRMKDSSRLIGLLEDTLSNTVRITEPKGCLAETFLTQVEQLMRMHVEATKIPREKKRGGRTVILAEMRRQFEREGVWDLMGKRISVAKYTREGDPLNMDCGYEVNGTTKLFQAISLESDGDAAMRLAVASATMDRTLTKEDRAKVELTAVVEPIHEIEAEPERRAIYNFGRVTMEENSIRVMVTSQLARMAATARTELRV